MAIFNGVELPDLPEYDTEAYPYAAIFGNGTEYTLVLSDVRPYVSDPDSDGDRYVTIDEVGNYPAWNIGEWNDWAEWYDQADFYKYDWDLDQYLWANFSLFQTTTNPTIKDPYMFMVGYSVGSRLRAMRRELTDVVFLDGVLHINNASVLLNGDILEVL